MRPGSCGFHRDGATDAVAGTGHQHDLAIEGFHVGHISSVRVCFEWFLEGHGLEPDRITLFPYQNIIYYTEYNL